MSTEAPSAQLEIDSLWRRLYWTLPLALLICATVFLWFAYSMEHSTKRTAEPVPVDAEIVELPANPVAQPRIHQRVIEQPKIKESAQQSRLPNIKEPALQPRLPNIKEPVQQPQLPNIPEETSKANPAPTTPTIAPPPPSTSTQSQTAQSVTRPLPEIPDELREEALREAATARFHIAIDGSTSVELLKPTGNPRLNRLLMDTLKRWKFVPAIKDGKPVASIEDIVIRVQVQ